MRQPSRDTRERSKDQVTAEAQSLNEEVPTPGPPPAEKSVPRSTRGVSKTQGRRGRKTGSSGASSAGDPGEPIRIDNFTLSTFKHFLDRPHPLLDESVQDLISGSGSTSFGSEVNIYNHEKHFTPRPPSSASLIMEGGTEATSEDSSEDSSSKKGKKGRSATASSSTSTEQAQMLAQMTSFSIEEIMTFHVHTVESRMVTRMTGKGKQQSYSMLTVVGNGDGLVGFGSGKDENIAPAVTKSVTDAILHMDYVQRFEKRTIERSMEGKWSAAKVQLRPRPPGFGLRCPPTIHAIARSAGITDLSASIIGSTNPWNVVRATLGLLWGGAHPAGLGNGIGGKSKRSDRGQGAKTIEDLEIERGRRYREVKM